ncbi:cyanophycin synthetase [Planktotalea frisia]|jgi:cyanophycin synthetase|uniref:Cyanophycin synthetase n=1 Tax=Planktotalea frisia TaxID=696762 RepID=A0A1L9NWV3_9RHOB|nr:cyanophycin synthetase [Planktotalea frisia]OJI93721.1 cyanophycin synthetase [Planktotalea frisia]PZX28855.1 cyanophycin synthetase [Planktotalea frisia]
MKILETSVFRGPNIYAKFPVIRHVVDIGILEEWPSAKIGEDFIEKLLDALPGLQEHGCSYREPGGFVRRLREDEGTWMAHIWEHMSIELQNVAGSDVSFGRTRDAGETGLYNMVFQYEQEEVGLHASQLALDFIHNLLPDHLVENGERVEGFDYTAESEAFIRTAQRKALGPSTASLVNAGIARDIPWMRLNEYSLIQLGYGKYQKRIQATITSETDYIATDLASDKKATNRILGDLGLPVPRQISATSAEDAVKAAKRIGFPVVVKPLDGNHGNGISINLMTAEAVTEAFDFALANNKRGRTIIVETFIEGLDHRMLVIDGKLEAVSKRVPGHIVGDGTHTAAELIEIVNSDPRRGVGHEKVLTRLELDKTAIEHLAEVGYDENTVLAEGEVVFLRSTANLSTGGTAVDVTDIVHPDNRNMAERAIKAIGLDIGGVDFLTADISQSYKDIPAGICEVNAAPGFRMHVAPSEGKPRDVSGAVMDMLFPAGTPSRVPIASITGTNGKTTVSRMVAHIHKLSGNTVGLATTDGVYIDGNLTVKGDLTGPRAAQMILRDPTVDAAILETARGGLLRSGMGYERCDVGAVINVDADHLGLKGIETVEDLARVKRIVVEVATDTAVLNADDELCLKMAGHTQADNICYVTMNAHHPLVREHVRLGGRAIVLEQGMNGHMITIYEKSSNIQLMWTHLIPATLDGKAMHNVQNAMFAAAICFSMGKSLEDIRQGLRTFATSYFQAPGRLNVFDEHPFKVILDYAHNPAAIEAMTKLCTQLEPKGRKIICFSMPGDRRDEDIVAAATIVAGKFDHYICKADDGRRGRGDSEVPDLLRKTLLENGVTDAQINVIPDEATAVDTALGLAAADDLLMVFGDNISRTWKQIIYLNRPEGVVEEGAAETTELVSVPQTLGAPDSTLDPLADATPVEDAPDIPENMLLGGMRMIRDARGVRLEDTGDEDGD